MRNLFRRILRPTAAALALGLLSAAPTLADNGTPLRLVVPYPAGGPTDTIARAIAPALGEELGQPVIIDNRAGASGTIGAGEVARAVPDGNTLLLNTSIHVILPHLRETPYDAIKDFTPLAVVNTIPFILVVNKDLPVRSVADLVAYAEAKPRELNFASNSSGSASHLAAEQFKKVAGIAIVHVPYKGSAPAITDLVGGHVQMMFEQGPSVRGFLTSEQLRAIAVTSAQRTRSNPQLPTLAESGFPGFDYTNWQGIWGPPNMPRAVKDKLVTALRKALQRPAVRQRLLDLGTEPADIYDNDFQAFLRQQYDYLGDIVKSANVKLD